MPRYVEYHGDVGGFPHLVRPLVSPAKARMIGRARKKAKNKANREMRNTNFDEDLSQNLREPARKTNPKSGQR
jgi:hypothetical protein